MLTLHLDAVSATYRDWCRAGCIEITCCAVAIAHRIAENIAAALRNMYGDYGDLRHCDEEFNLRECRITWSRLFRLSVACATLMTDPASHGDPWALPQNVRSRNIVLAYHQKLRSGDPELLHVFTTLLHGQPLPTYEISTHATRRPSGCCACS